MPFPFLPFGALLALGVLGGAFAVFGAVLRLFDRAALSARNTIAPTVVRGLRGWSQPRDVETALEPATVDQVDGAAAVATERVRRH
jgi:hypothetical protein